MTHQAQPPHAPPTTSAALHTPPPRAWLRRGLWLMMTLMCLIFAPSAAEFYWVNATAGTASYARLLAATVSEAYAYGPESGFAVMTPYWRSMPAFNQVVLGVHAFLASIALVIGPFLFSRTVRRRWRWSHRVLGRVYVALGIVAMLLSMVYLSITPMTRIYGGAPFAMGLWGISVMTLYTLIVGAWHIVRGEIHEHRAVMVLNFSAMLIAPLLRLWWLILGWSFSHDPSVMQEETHVAVLMFLGLETMLGAIVVNLALHWRQQARRTSPTIVRWRQRALEALPSLTRLATAVGVVTALLFIHQSVLRFLGAPDLWGAFKPEAIALRELEIFQHAPHLFVAEAIALTGLWLTAPRLLRKLFSGPSTTPHRVEFWLFGGFTAVAAMAWLGQAASYGRSGVAGWGSMVFWGSLALGLLLLLALWALAWLTDAQRQRRELTLHVLALSMAPALLGLMQLGFLLAGFNWTEAFLSAAVASTSLTLSGSYYYTVYSGRP